MKRHSSIVTSTITVAALSLVAVTALAGEIYKHVDADGTVTYRDRPTGESGEEILATTYKRTDNATVQAEVARRQQYVASMNEKREARQTQETEQAQAALSASEQAAKCQEYRDRLQSYLQSRRLYRENADGEREYLDDAQALAARQKVEDLIKKDCS